MGVDYYIVCDEKEELFELGRGPFWPSLFLRAARVPRELFVDELRSAWSIHYSDDDVSSEYVASMARTIWQWCEARSWDVRVISDAQDMTDMEGWPTTGSLHELSPEENVSLSDSKKQERYALGGHQQAVIRVVSDLRLYRQAAKRLLDKVGDGGFLTLHEFERTVAAIEAGESPEPVEP